MNVYWLTVDSSAADYKDHVLKLTAVCSRGEWSGNTS